MVSVRTFQLFYESIIIFSRISLDIISSLLLKPMSDIEVYMAIEFSLGWDV